MCHNAAHPPPGPAPKPGAEPGPYDPPSPPPAQPPRPSRSYAEEFPAPANLRESRMYPGQKTFHPSECGTHTVNGTPAHAITSHR